MQQLALCMQEFVLTVHRCTVNANASMHVRGRSVTVHSSTQQHFSFEEASLQVAQYFSHVPPATLARRNYRNNCYEVVTTSESHNSRCPCQSEHANTMNRQVWLSSEKSPITISVSRSDCCLRLISRFESNQGS
jgi:hypothetical protein